jgi:GNAT superfamily N-acetyltransferase
LVHRKTAIAFLSTMAVREDARRAGVGRALVEAVETQARAWGCETIELTSRNDRHEAHRFWEALGFEARSRKFVRKVGTP